jgi:adenine-specific DNA-methyltransferase
MENEKDRLVISKTKSGEYTLSYKDNREYIEENVKSIIGDISSSLGTVLIHDLYIHFSNPKPIKLIKYLINLCPKKDNQIILDFFAGSGTTGQAV